MKEDLANRLLDSARANLDSASEWTRAQQFFYNALQAVRSLLPAVVQDQLARRGNELPSDACLEAARVALWTSIKSGQLGSTREDLAIRAAMFAFAGADEKQGPYDAIAYFCDLFSAAGLPEEAVARAFREQWPENST